MAFVAFGKFRISSLNTSHVMLCRRMISEQWKSFDLSFVASSLLHSETCLSVFLCRFASSGTPLSALDPAGYPTVEATYKKIADNLTVR